MQFLKSIRIVPGFVGDETRGACFIFLATRYNNSATGIVNGLCELSIFEEHNDVKSYNLTTSSSLPDDRDEITFITDANHGISRLFKRDF